MDSETTRSWKDSPSALTTKLEDYLDERAGGYLRTDGIIEGWRKPGDSEADYQAQLNERIDNEQRQQQQSDERKDEQEQSRNREREHSENLEFEKRRRSG